MSDKCGCAPDLIISKQTGFIFQSGNEQDLLQCLQKFSTKEVAAQMGQQAAAHISYYSLQQVAASIEREVLR